MKHHNFILILFCFSLVVSCSSPPTKMMTYNIRYDNPNDGDNWWDLRKDEVVELIKNYNPDFIGLQEALPNQTAFIAEKLDAYHYIGHGRDGVGTNSEGAPIFYNKARYDLIESETIWLSETPDTISRGWDAALNRIVTYGVFQDKTNNQSVHIFNAHFDHMGELARFKSAELLVNYMRTNNLSNKQVVLMGDFNALPTESPIQLLTKELEDSYNTKGVPVEGPTGTFNAFDTNATATKRIDYIFTKNVVVKSYRCIDDRRANDLHVSDHFALIIEM